MWITYIAPHQDTKKMIKTKEKLLSLKGDKAINNGVSNAHKEAFLREFEKYKEKTKQQ